MKQPIRLLLLPVLFALAPRAGAHAGAPPDAGAPASIASGAPAPVASGAPAAPPDAAPAPDGGGAPVAAPDAGPVPDDAQSPPSPTPLPAALVPPPPAPPEGGALRVNEVTVVGTRERRTAGSAHILKSRDLERLDHDDPQQVLRQVPGVYGRTEDAFGLRPNIGLRGVNPDRSKKVTLMEDGVLFGPAPYAAPAAYYFPLITRMEAVRVIKGPGAVSFGPQTVAGAVDLVTRRVPPRLQGGFDLGAGQYGYGKGHGFVGASNRHLGFLLEGVHLRSSGFKELDGGGDTGFRRNEAMAKLRWVPLPGARVHNELELKLGYSDEDSNETYLGLTDEDFRKTPLRRYFASRLDHMQWDRTQAALRHVADFGRGRSIETVAYRHDMSRTWKKVNGFSPVQVQVRDGGTPALGAIIRAPFGVNRDRVSALQGAADTDPARTGNILIGPNQRDFVSQGIQSVGRIDLAGGGLAHRLELGARFHYDRIDRHHSEDQFAVRSGQLVPLAGTRAITADERDEARALALHVGDAVTWRRLTVTPGLRFELIDTKSTDRLGGTSRKGAQQRILIPGLGAYYGITDVVGVLGGVYRGFSPAGPGEPRSVSPEKSWNYEAGVRAAGGVGRAEVIGFFNDYQNLTSSCTLASGCPMAQLDRQYAAGRAHVWGVEVFGQSDWKPAPGLLVPITLAYTHTRTRLRDEFTSGDPQLGMVFPGDELPYVPRHQGALTAGLETRRFGLDAAAVYTSRMREQAGAGDPPPDFSTDPSLIFEAGGRVYLWRTLHVYVHARNLTNAADLAARRPYGARPIAPRWIQAGLKASF